MAKERQTAEALLKNLSLHEIFANRYMGLAKIKSIGLDQVNNWSLPLVLGDTE